MEAYSVAKISECGAPSLEDVDATFILTMKNSTRTPRSELNELSPVTFVQTNLGYTTVPKNGVDGPSRDIVHAIQNVCRLAQDYDNVLILEDDAEIMKCTSRTDFERVNRTIKLERDNDFIYTFGSIGLILPSRGCTCRFVSPLGFAQAIVYSKQARGHLLEIDVSKVKHIDVHFISKRPNTLTYMKPLIVQRFPRTRNMKHWSATLNPTFVERVLVRLFVFILQNVLCLQYSTYGWFIIYALNHIISIVTVAALATIITLMSI